MLTAKELAAMRATQAAAFADTAEILRYVAGAPDAYNVPDPQRPADPAIACSFDPRPGTGQALGGANVPLYDARARLPIGTVIGQADWIRITHRNGEAITPLTFEIVGMPEQTATALVCRLNLMTLEG
jgi:hypothetical protein